MKKVLIFVLAFILAFGSCKKTDTEIEFKGIVLDLKDNMPIPNVLTEIFVSNGNPDNLISMSKSTWTNSDGEYEFIINSKDFTQYSVRAYKDQYVQFSSVEGRWWGRAFYYNSPNIDEFLLNYDTITLGRETVLKIKIDILDTTNWYAIDFSDNLPPDSIDQYYIDPLTYDTVNVYALFNTLNYSTDPIINIYQYDIYKQRYVSWYKKDGHLLIRHETVLAEFTPFDTCYVDLVLE